MSPAAGNYRTFGQTQKNASCQPHCLVCAAGPAGTALSIGVAFIGKVEQAVSHVAKTFVPFLELVKISLRRSRR